MKPLDNETLFGMENSAAQAKSGVKWLWLSRNEAERRIGTQELQDRVRRRTIVWRKNPEDTKYYQFRFLVF